METFSEFGHSGGSMEAILPVMFKLLCFENLTPLSDDPTEWIHHEEDVWGEPGGIWQNIRNSKAFSKDGGKTYLFFVGGEGESERSLHNSVHKVG